MSYPKPLKILIEHFRKLPGVGKKTAARYAFELLEWKQQELGEFSKHIGQIQQLLHTCQTCGSLCEVPPCPYCDLEHRDGSKLCVVATAKDVFLVEEGGFFKGLYHVTKGLISPLDKRMPEALHLTQLTSRLTGVQEIILALEPTIEGDATSLFLRDMLSDYPVKITRLALGLPMGSSLDFIDEQTLSTAFSGRTHF